MASYSLRESYVAAPLLLLMPPLPVAVDVPDRGIRSTGVVLMHFAGHLGQCGVSPLNLVCIHNRHSGGMVSRKFGPSLAAQSF